MILKDLKKKTGRLLRKRIRRMSLAYDEWKYRRVKPHTVFDIRVSRDMSFKMSFGDYKLDSAIVERIEGRREPATVATIKALVKKGSKVLEIGGCYGYFTAIMALCVGTDGAVVSLEGTPRNFSILKNNIKLNNFTNVDVYNVFVAADTDKVYFKEGENNPYAAIKRIGRSYAGSRDMMDVPCVQLSSFLESIGFLPDYIFMDIEGFEIDVFEDFSGKYFQQTRPTIVLEIHESLYRPGRDLPFIQRILEQYQYDYRYMGGNLLCFPE